MRKQRSIVLVLMVLLFLTGCGQTRLLPKPTPTPSVRLTEFAVPGEPEEITAGPDGNLWFTENFFNQNSATTVNKIGRITPTGTLTEFAVPTPSNTKEGLGLLGITAGRDGNLWFAEIDRNLIGRITPTGSFTEFPVPTANSRPLWLTTGPDGNVWFTEDRGGKIGRITPAGVITEFPIPTQQSESLGITTGPDGNLWFTETAGKIGRITPDGTFMEFPVSGSPFSIVSGSDGNLWFTEAISKTEGKIARLTTSGVITEFPLPTPGRALRGITSGPDGNLWFTEFSCDADPCMTSHSWIGRITTGGTYTDFPLPTPTNFAYGITTGPESTLWFTDLNGKIGRITFGKQTAQGQTSVLLAQWGAPLEATLKRPRLVKHPQVTALV